MKEEAKCDGLRLRQAALVAGVAPLAGLLAMVASLGVATAQTNPPKQTEAQKRVQAKLLQQKQLECAKVGRYAVATTIRGTTIYKCGAKPNG